MKAQVTSAVIGRLAFEAWRLFRWAVVLSPVWLVLLVLWIAVQGEPGNGVYVD